MRKIASESEFEKVWNEKETLVCDFSAAWCGPCSMLEPVLKRIEKENPSVAFLKVDVDEMWDLSEKHGVEAMPTILFVKKGKVVKRIVGLETYEKLSKQVKKLVDKDGA